MKQFIKSVVFLLWVCNPLIAQQTVQGSFTFDGLNRSYRLYIPENYNPGTKAPLIMNLHGYGSNNLEQEIYGDFRPIADTAGFLLVHPNGTLDAFNNRHWNTFGTSQVDDVGFLSALIDTLSAHYDIDPKRVYSTGMSNGGFMSFSLACALSERIAAIASVAGTITGFNLEECLALRPVPVMQIHGTADGTIPYDGNPLFVSVPHLIDFWVEHNQCIPEPIITELPDIDPTDGCTAEKHLYADGLNGSTVVHYKIIDGGHSWPGAPIIIDVTNMDFSASEEIWRFFSQYDLDGLVTQSTQSFVSEHFVSAFPNPAKGSVMLQFDKSSPKQIKVYNSTGQLVDRYQCDCRQLTLRLPSSGLYVVSVFEGNQVQHIKVLIQ